MEKTEIQIISKSSDDSFHIQSLYTRIAQNVQLWEKNQQMEVGGGEERMSSVQFLLFYQ